MAGASAAHGTPGPSGTPGAPATHGTGPTHGAPASAGATAAGTTAGDRLGYDGDDGDVVRRRRPPSRSRLPVVLAVGAFVALALAGIAIGIATRDDGGGEGRAGSPSSSTTSGDGLDENGFCTTGRWPPVVQGQPASLGDATETGYYVWNDAFGWHVRMVDTGEVPGRFTGEVVSSANLTSSEVVPEGAGEVRVSGNTLTWDFPGSIEPTGFDVAVGGCAADTVRFTLNDANGPVAESRIFVGTNSTAVSNPLLVRRQG